MQTLLSDLFRDLKILEKPIKRKEKVEEFKPTHTYKKTTEDILKENIAQIPGYVPYNPGENVIVIDNTRLPAVTEKPKKGREKI